jgi:hypothetical protein
MEIRPEMNVHAMKRIKLNNTTGYPEDCSRYERWLDDAGIPFKRIEQGSSGAILIHLDDQFAQPAHDLLRVFVPKQAPRIQPSLWQIVLQIGGFSDSRG